VFQLLFFSEQYYKSTRLLDESNTNVALYEKYLKNPLPRRMAYSSEHFPNQTAMPIGVSEVISIFHYFKNVYIQRTHASSKPFVMRLASIIL